METELECIKTTDPQHQTISSQQRYLTAFEIEDAVVKLFSSIS